MLLHLPESLAERFKQAVPARQRSAFVAGLLEQALPEEDDPLYRIALEVERDAVLTAEMREWREALVGDGIHETDDAGGKPHAAR